MCCGKPGHLKLITMSYTVLARKYRSQTFDDVIGQDPISRTLKNAIKTDKAAHAYLFTGTRGVGKTTMARILAKAFNCHSFDEPTTEPCCKCDSCVPINIGEDIDVIEIDGASNNSVDEVRRLRENAIYRPARSRFKIYIIDEVHMLSTSAFNALLKILEEPPSHVKFIFATTEPNKVIATVQSRCQRFDFGNISSNLIAGQLPLAKMANGSMRDGLSLLDRLISTGAEPLTVELLEEYLGCPNSEKVYNLVSEIGDSDAAGTLEAVEDLINTGLSDVQIVDSLVDCMRDLMVAKSTSAETELLTLTAEQRKRAGELAEKFDIAALVYNITTLEKLRWTIKNSDTPRALLEASLIRFALSEHFLNVDALLSEKQSTPVKKKRPAALSTELKAPFEPAKSPTDEPPSLAQLSDIESINSNWPDILKIIIAKLGPGTGGLLSSAKPSHFEDGQLTLEFGASAGVSKKMCDSNGRREAIESLLSEHFRKPIELKLEIACEGEVQLKSDSKQIGTSSQRKNEIVNDPAVKTVLMGLGATITGIEELKE